MARRAVSEDGLGLVATLMFMAILVTLGVALLLITVTETTISANYRDGIETFYAAEGALERVLPDLLDLPDWNVAFAGGARSTFVDALPGLTRVLGGGSVVNLADATNMARCGSVAPCSDADMDAMSEERPWGRNNPRWQLYGYGAVRDLLPPGRLDSRIFVAIWVADDPFENDDDPLKDGALPTNPGRGAAFVRAHAYGSGGQRRMIEGIVARAGMHVRLLSWRELR